MSIIIDEFDLNHQKDVSTDPQEFEAMKDTEDFVNGFTKIALNYDDHNTVFENVFTANKISANDTNTNTNYQTHFIIKGMKLSFKKIIESTSLEAFSTATHAFCLKYGENIGITNAKSVYDKVDYVTHESNSNVEPMMYQIANAFKLKVICIYMPIASDSSKVRFDDEFFQKYGKATTKQIKDQSAIISIRSVFAGDPVPGYIPIPEELIKLIENK